MTRFIIGYRGVNKQGLDYEVIDDRLAKKTKIKFDLDGAVVETTSANAAIANFFFRIM